MKKNLTEMVFILDKSGSMAGLEADTIGGFNSMIERQKRESGEALVSTLLFSNRSTVLHDRVGVQSVEPLTERQYQVGGCTALIDAIGCAIHHIGNVHKYARDEMNIWKAGIMGVVTGDALGCPVQFESRETVAKHPVTGMRGYGTFNLPAGSWTDDSSLTRALFDSIKRTGGIDYIDIMENFVSWLEDGAFTPYGYSYDIGRGTMNAIRKYKRDRKPHKAGSCDERNNGNGSLMRIMPAVLYCIDKGLSDRDAIDVVHKVGSLTHAHIRANIACGLYFFMARAILAADGSLTERLQAGLSHGFAFYEDYLADHENLEYYNRLRDLSGFAALPAERIHGTGYVVDALEAAVWSLVTTDSFEAALLRAVNLGDDTDTVGVIAGGFAGLFYGYEAIPEDWLAALQRRDWIEDMVSGIVLG